MTFKPKVMVIGLDGMSFHLLDSWLNFLPTFKNLVKRGTFGILKTSFGRTLIFKNIQSFTSWTSFSTGKNANKHGIYSCKKNGKIITSKSIKDKRIWTILSDNNFKVGIINVCVTYPAEPVNGFMIAGWPFLGDKGLTYPEDLIKEVQDYRFEVPVTSYAKQYPNINYNKLLDDIYDVAKKRKKIVLKLMKQKWDFFLVNFTGTDEIQHFFWHFMDKSHPQYDPILAQKYRNAIFDFYKFMDSTVNDILKKFKGVTFVISDHGFCSKFDGWDWFSTLKRRVALKFGKSYPPWITGTHHPDGVLIVNGKGIKKNYRIYGARLIDVTPTILYIFNIPIPNDMDGEILKDIFENYV